VLRLDLPGGHLRLLEESDADELFALTDRNRDRLTPWLPCVRYLDIVAYARLATDPAA
jgi:hypothetical protein